MKKYFAILYCEFLAIKIGWYNNEISNKTIQTAIMNVFLTIPRWIMMRALVHTGGSAIHEKDDPKPHFDFSEYFSSFLYRHCKIKNTMHVILRNPFIVITKTVVD